jgi:hypothetical protein
VEYRSDPDLPPLTTGPWMSAKVRFSDDAVTVVEQEQIVSAVLPTGSGLAVRAWPNPTSARLTIRFDLPRAAPTRAEVYDLGGRRVAVLADGILPGGPHRFVWDGRGPDGRRQSDGVYFVRVKTGTMQATRRVALVR